MFGLKLRSIFVFVNSSNSFNSIRAAFEPVIFLSRFSSSFATKPYTFHRLCRRFSSGIKPNPREMPSSKPFERLPKDVVPTHYEITLRPDLENFSIHGSETVHVQVKKPTKEITLNALELDIQVVEYTAENGTVIKSSNIETSQDNETATFSFPSPLNIGEGKLFLKFIGVLNDKMKGLYRTRYTTADGSVRYAAATQFEATHARQAFPCWDEPAIKATFDIILIAPKDRVVLSNTNVISDTPWEEDPNLRIVKFATSPIMSTYLVACVIGEYDFVEGKSADGVNIRVYTPLGKTEQGEFALEVAVKTLPFYKEYFNIAYPLPKLDLIAVPDFASGAMENWGLVIYRENCLLVDPQNTSSSRKQWIALVICHELAHQWFGNLVTMEWWTHLWLNEGFASWIEFLCVDHLFPHFHIWTQFVTDTLIHAEQLDALRNSHPIEVPVGHPAEVDEIFDDISYNKGASIIRMLHSYIGDEDFRKGMNHYLTKHQYKNTFTEDLWESLELASKKPIGTVMSTWTKQMGYPLIKVTQTQEGNDRILSLSQSKFSADGEQEIGESFHWLVPISVCKASDPKEVVVKHLLDTKTAKIVINNVKEKEWVKLNPGTVGYYRTQYPPEMLEMLLPSIRDRTLPPLDRLGLQDDIFALVQSGHTSTVDVLKLMEAFVNEDNYTVWQSVNNALSKLSLLLAHTDCHDLFKSYGRDLLSTITAKIGWDPLPDESHLDMLLRSLVITRMAVFEDPAVNAEAKKRFEAHANKVGLIPADLRAAVYRSVVGSGDEKTMDTMLRLYKETDLQEEKDRISRSLGHLKDPALLTRVMDFAMSDEVRSQDSIFVLINVALNPVGREMAWRFFQENFKTLVDRYECCFLLSRLVKYTTENFASEEKARQVEAFFTEHPVASAERTVQQSIESIRLNAKWLARDLPAIKTYLVSRK